MDSENLISSSAYLLFYRKRSTRPLGGDLREKINDFVTGEDAVSLEQTDRSMSGNRGRDTSIPPYHSVASDSSPATSSSGEARPDNYVPFIGPGRPLGGMLDDDYRPTPAASNPFSTSTWGTHAPVRFATTNSETSEPLYNEQENENRSEWSNSD